MKLVKLGLISLVVFCLLIFCLSLLFPSHIRISRAVNINAPAETVKPLVTDLNNWKGWNELILADSNKVVYYTDSTLHSEKLFYVNRLSVKGDTMQIAWRQQNGRVTEGGFTWYKSGNVTVVQWYFDFHLRWYPWEKFSSLLLESQLGLPMERSLSKLKKMAEGN